MRIDISNLPLPDPEAVTRLKAEVRRLEGAITALADQDATLSVCNGNVIVTMDATLTDVEREAVEGMAAYFDTRGNLTFQSWGSLLRVLLMRL